MTDRTETNTKVDPDPLARTIGVLVTILTGILAVGVGLYVDHGIGPMLALILVIGLALVTGYMRGRDRWAPLFVGLVIGIIWLLLAWAAYCTHSPNAIYAQAVTLVVFLCML